jgi:hypothetical protein
MKRLECTSNPPKPAPRCSLCGILHIKSNGQRIVATQLVGVVVSGKHLGGGNPDYPDASFPLDETGSSWLTVKALFFKVVVAFCC